LFWPTFSCQILIIFSFLESHMTSENGLLKFCSEIFANFFVYNLSKEISTFLGFLIYTSGYLRFCNFFFANLKWHGHGLFKNVYFIFFGHFFADSKSRALELSNNVSFVIFWHQTWKLELELIIQNWIMCIFRISWFLSNNFFIR